MSIEPDPENEFDAFIGPFSRKHYIIAEILQPGLWSESSHEHIRWCLWARQSFHRKNTYFGVQFWFKRIDLLSKADKIIKAIGEEENEC